MEIKIGIRQSNRELTVDVDSSIEDITAQVNEAIAQGTVLTLKDSKNRTVLVPAQALAYIEAGSETAHRVGFGIGETALDN